jgi:hypothetical protein
LARAINSLPSAGAMKLTLISTVTPILPFCSPDVTAIPAGLVGQRRDHPAVEMTEELHQIVAARQCEFSLSRLDSDDAKACGAGEAPGIDGFGEARRIEVAHESLSF